VKPVLTSSVSSNLDEHFNENDIPSWEDYFDEKFTLVNPKDDYEFNVYRTGNCNLPAFIFIHGGGFTGLTWASFTSEIVKLSKVQCIAPDLRGHGLSQIYDENVEEFYSLDNFAKDLTFILSNSPGFKDVPNPPPIIICGHSMGGAIASHLANYELFPYNIACLALIDVIEGSAIAALSSMKQVLSSRPSSFDSIERAISWALATSYIKCNKSVRISMPSQIKKSEDKSCYVWRTDLSETSGFWHDWFKGMDKKFLNAKCGPKLVLIANPNNLDKEMTIAQMQGKFQIQMLPGSGHAVHEDCAKRIAVKFSAYLKRFRIAEPLNSGFSDLPIGVNIIKSYGSG